MSKLLTILCWSQKKWDQLCAQENTGYPPLDLAIPDTLAISQPGAKQNFGPQIVEKKGQKFRTFDSFPTITTILWSRILLRSKFWYEDCIRDGQIEWLISCVLWSAKLVSLLLSLMSETIKAKALGDVAHFIKSILSFTELKPRSIVSLSSRHFT